MIYFLFEDVLKEMKCLLGIYNNGYNDGVTQVFRDNLSIT
jgi:hypothetical protein